MSEQVDLDVLTNQFIEEFASAWSHLGSSAMDGRVLGCLLISNGQLVSSKELSQRLGSSQSAISTSTRHLIEMGMITRRWIKGDRTHYFVANEDPWGSALANDAPAWARLQSSLRPSDSLTAKLSDDAVGRLRNAADYFAWINDRRESLVAEWEDYKRQRDQHQDGSEVLHIGARAARTGSAGS